MMTVQKNLLAKLSQNLILLLVNLVMKNFSLDMLGWSQILSINQSGKIIHLMLIGLYNPRLKKLLNALFLNLVIEKGKLKKNF